MSEYKVKFDVFLERAFSYRRELLLAAVILTVCAVSLGGYWWYKRHVSREAHKAYAQGTKLVEGRVLRKNESKGIFETAFRTIEEKWTSVANAFDVAQKRYPHVGMGVMAGVSRAQALIRLRKYDEARFVLKSVLSRIKSDELRALYTLTYSLLLLDSEQAADVEAGIGLLQRAGASKNNVVQDTALYHLGLYYWHKGDFTSARNYWKQFLLHYQFEIKHPSVWGEQVKEMLSLIEGDEEHSH